MGSEHWKSMTLGDFVTLQRGHDLPQQVRHSGSVPILGSFGITGFHDQAKAQGPGVTIGRSGASFGVVSYSPVDYWPLNTVLYVVDFHGNDERFAYYFLHQFDFKRYNTGSVQPSLNRNHIHPIPVKVPSLPEQCAIAHILGSLDDKIELNRQMNRTLEKMAQAIFKSWFIDFDPVQAKAEGRDPGPPKEIADLFPDSFEDSELGPIPKGWEISTIGENAAKLSKGTTPRKKDVLLAEDSPTIPFLKVKNISDSGEIDISSLEKIPRSIHEGALKRSMLKAGDVLFSIAGTIGRVTILPMELDDSNTNQAIAFIRPQSHGLPAQYMRLLLLTDRMQFEAKSRVVQGVQANVSLTVLSELKFPKPPSELVDFWSKYCTSIFEQQMLLFRESRILVSIRDTLLPKLISGELCVPDVEKFIEEAGV